MKHKKIIKKVIAKLEAQKIYEKEEIQNLINSGTKKFPNYNINKEESSKVVDFVFKKINPKFRSKELESKILSGIT